MKIKRIPSVAILLAAYNGESWISDQISSILSQKNVQVHIFVSVDLSTDSTFNLLSSYCNLHPNISILSYGMRYGTAAKNFYRLICDVDISNYDYVAFSDQDDIWMPSKLSTGISSIESNSYDAFSSDVIAFWPDGKRSLVRKSQSQKKYDFMFQSAGPGCTYIFKNNVFEKLQRFVIDNFNLILNIEHDWLSYSFCRSHNFRWHIDQRPLMYYRQHDSNQFGANASFRSYLGRLLMIRDGWYTNHVLNLAIALKLSVPDRKFLLFNMLQLRRKLSESLLVFFFLFFAKPCKVKS